MLQPKDAQITIDGKRYASGTAIELSKGRHRIKIEKEGFKTIEKTMDVSKSKVYFNYTLSEVDLQAVQIKSRPSGAQIYINGQDKGVMGLLGRRDGSKGDCLRIEVQAPPEIF